jgi:GH35 family endo-1,4-beta-xylanase
MPTDTDAQKQELRTVYEDYVTATASHFAGRVQMWDMCNEQLLPAYVFSGYQTGHSYWKAYQQAEQGLESGIEWYRQTFRLARAADPLARLILLDFNNEIVCPKADRMLKLVTQLKSEGVPVDGVGFQMHLGTDLNRSKNHGLKDDESYYASLKANLRRFSETGLDLWITELDVRLDPAKDIRTELARQAQIYGRVTEIAASKPRMKGIKFWGIVDRDAWGKVIPERPNLFDEDGKPKPAFEAVRRALIRVLDGHRVNRNEPRLRESNTKALQLPGKSDEDVQRENDIRSARTLLKALDTNGDGRVSLAEAEARGGGHWLRWFPLLDKNKDGFITVEEQTERSKNAP